MNTTPTIRYPQSRIVDFILSLSHQQLNDLDLLLDNPDIDDIAYDLRYAIGIIAAIEAKKQTANQEPQP